MSNAKNKASAFVMIIFSIIFLIVGILFVFFDWKFGLIMFLFSAVFFGFSKLSKISVKQNEEVIEKIQGMKDPEPNEVI